MLVSPDHISNGQRHLEDHPATRVRVQRSQGPQGSIETIGDSNHLPIEQRHAFTEMEFPAIPPSRTANLDRHFLIDLYFAHRQTSVSDCQTTFYCSDRILVESS